MMETRKGRLLHRQFRSQLSLTQGFVLCLTAVLLVSQVGVASHRASDEKGLVRFSKPGLLSFDELVELEQNDSPALPLAEKLERLLTTPIINNEATLDGAKPKRPSSPELGPFLRVICWNIERGIQFDAIRIALSEPQKFNGLVVTPADAKDKPLNEAQLQVVKKQLELLQPADLLILNEVDYGVTRTDYRDVAHDLAKALNMNYVYGVEFLEIDPLNLGLEKVKMDDKTAQEDIQKSFDVDKSRYLGMHGTAVLSRYPIRQARLRPLAVCYDWYTQEKKEISKLEAGKRMGRISPSWRESRARYAEVAARS